VRCVRRGDSSKGVVRRGGIPCEECEEGGRFL